MKKTMVETCYVCNKPLEVKKGQQVYFHKECRKDRHAKGYVKIRR